MSVLTYEALADGAAVASSVLYRPDHIFVSPRVFNQTVDVMNGVHAFGEVEHALAGGRANTAKDRRRLARARALLRGNARPNVALDVLRWLAPERIAKHV